MLALDPTSPEPRPDQAEAVADAMAFAEFVPDLAPCDAPEVIPATELELEFRHSGWKAMRAKVRSALARAGCSPRVLARFDHCGANARVVWSESTQKHYVRGSYCKNRHCRPCMRAKATQIANNIDARIKRRAIGRYRFGTLTLLHTRDPLPDQVKRLRDAFTDLRKTKIFKTQVGGCWTWETKIGKDGLWHPHIHYVSEGSYMAQCNLSGAWSKITGNSMIVDVRAVRNPDNIGCELTKYIAKGTSSNVWNDELMAIEWVVASRGMRACGTWGSWRHFKLTEKTLQPADVVHVGRLDIVYQAAKDGQRWAVMIIDTLLPGDITFDTS